jgi:hypothetical protein
MRFVLYSDEDQWEGLHFNRSLGSDPWPVAPNLLSE